ncbi:hypothetical protein EUGRSUZ_H04730 [Eucalyptus grandis]|uniref:Uncharacterized protein n=2 Tax=Eucalyptus grandis TaxID=71139 RepID=A0ACC3JY71_EUCGR|nr:hypothetical protein EUGRSUZ_H04730 [Eucalyptus grandis]
MAKICAPGKPRILCLHGFRTSAAILETQIRKWPESILEKLDLVFLDARYPSAGKSSVEGIFDPPYYEWFQFQVHQGVALTKVPKIKFVIIISGAKAGGAKYTAPKLAANAFAAPIKCPSLHFIGEQDFQKTEGLALIDSFVDPLVIHHPKAHTVPRLDDQSVKIAQNFVEKILNLATT